MRVLDKRLLEAALAEVHPCAHGHKWRSVGAMACCCDLGDFDGECSLPVYGCVRCGDCDYGENADAAAVKAACACWREEIDG